MIPDFKTYLKESVWMDIHKRSTGEAERKEEDINLLDMNSFHKYLCDRYEKTNDYFKNDGYINIFPQSHIINIMLFENTEESRVYRVIIWEFNKTPYITIPRKPLFIQSDFFKKIEEKYTLVKSGDDLSPLFTVKSKDGSDDSSNKFFVEVIDFLLDNIEPPFDPYLKRVDDVNESVWMDIHKHSTGDVERKEDRLVGAVKNLVPVDLGGKCLWADRDLEIDGQTAFTYDDASQFIDGVNGWRLPTFTDIMNLDTRIMYNDYSFQDDELHITNRKTNGELVFSNQGPYPGLRGFYYFWHVDGGIRYGKASYFVKNDKNNKCVVGSFGSSDPGYTFCIRLVKDKEVSESVWMDIHKHSTGDVERMEDNVDNLDFNDFVKYVQDRYVILSQPGFYEIHSWVSGRGVKTLYIPIERNNQSDTPNFGDRSLVVEQDLDTCEYMCILPNEYVFKLYPRELEKAFNDKYDVDHSAKTITPQDGKITNSVIIDVIDRLIKMVDHPLLRKNS